jgi:diaminopimelate epimerase
MLPMHFIKMHGCGNDYVYLDGWQTALPADLPALARRLSDRHTGVGGDGLIVVGPSSTADARMLMFNSDGSQSEMCGNGIRCAAKLAYDRGHVHRAHAALRDRCRGSSRSICCSPASAAPARRC